MAYYNLPLSVSVAYEEILLAHIAAVREAGRMLGVSEAQLAQHDLSKWSQEEYPAYAMKFCGGGISAEAFSFAWLHHIHHNPHHWEHWIVPGRRKILRMPNVYVEEMIADWMGAEKVYNQSEDMTVWLTKNWPKITLHRESRESARSTLSYWGYGDIVTL